MSIPGERGTSPGFQTLRPWNSRKPTPERRGLLMFCSGLLVEILGKNPALQKFVEKSSLLLSFLFLPI